VCVAIGVVGAGAYGQEGDDAPVPLPSLVPLAPTSPVQGVPPPTALPPIAAGPVRVAVYEAQASAGISERTARVVSEALLAEVRKLDRVAAVGMKEIHEMLSFEEQRQLLGCGEDSCFAEIAGALGVDELVLGTLGALGDAHLISVKRIDLREATTRAAASRNLVAGDGEEFLSVIGSTVEEVFPEYPLRPGRVRGVSPEVAARLNPPPLPRWSFFVTAGAAVAAAGVGGLFGALYVDAQDQYDGTVRRALREDGGVSASTLRAEARRVESNARAANIALGVAGALALAAGVQALFTDWRGVGADDAPASPPAVSLHVTPAGIAVAWR
jgi:hypothetical protein